jgi:hypothetical protein
MGQTNGLPGISFACPDSPVGPKRLLAAIGDGSTPASGAPGRVLESVSYSVVADENLVYRLAIRPGLLELSPRFAVSQHIEKRTPIINRVQRS